MEFMVPFSFAEFDYIRISYKGFRFLVGIFGWIDYSKKIHIVTHGENRSLEIEGFSIVINTNMWELLIEHIGLSLEPIYIYSLIAFYPVGKLCIWHGRFLFDWWGDSTRFILIFHHYDDEYYDVNGVQKERLLWLMAVVLQVVDFVRL
jgi:hypothetical protein